MLKSTGKFKVHEIIYNNGEFALARGNWETETRLSLACRWHDDGMGYPQTFGKPQWMMFPRDVTVEMCNALDMPEAATVAVTFLPPRQNPNANEKAAEPSEVQPR